MLSSLKFFKVIEFENFDGYRVWKSCAYRVCILLWFIEFGSIYMLIELQLIFKTMNLFLRIDIVSWIFHSESGVSKWNHHVWVLVFPFLWKEMLPKFFKIHQVMSIFVNNEGNLFELHDYLNVVWLLDWFIKCCICDVGFVLGVCVFGYYSFV